MTHDNSIPNSDIALSLDVAETRRKTLADLIPEAFSEGRLDISALKRALGEPSLIDGGERYRLDWAGKSDAYKVLQTPSSATLRPQPELSINFDAAQHIFIEGENLEVLKVLQKAYFGKVKLIYIDPPYNTGSDSFIYPDRYQESKEEYLKRINDLTDDGTLMREGFFRKNNRENGQFHSNWLSMMLPRLYIARNLLRDDGFIVVSIDDNEINNLRSIMNEVFGEENFAADLVFDRNRKNDAKLFSIGHEYMVVYARNKQLLSELNIRLRAPKEGVDELRNEFERLRHEHGDNWELVAQGLKDFYETFEEDDPRLPLTRYTKVDEKGPYRDDGNPSWPGGGGPRYDVPHPITGKPCKVPSRGWVWPTYERMKVEINKGNIRFGPDETTIPGIRTNLFEKDNQVMRSVTFSYAQKATQDFAAIFNGNKVFDNPKSFLDIERLILYLTEPGDLVIDFFAGSNTTLHSVLRVNQRGEGSRQAICIQLPELIDTNTESGRNALSFGFQTIADIARKRIHLAIEKIKTEADFANPVPKDLGIKCFQLTPSNFKQWRGDGIETSTELAEQIEMFVDSVKSGAKTDDLLFELLLKFGQPLTIPIEWLDIEGQRIAAIHNRSLLFVLEGFSFEMIEQLLALKPKEIIALDRVFAKSDELQSNLDLACRDAEVKFTCI